MSIYPSVSGKQLTKVLKKYGFELIHVKGSHHFLRHADGRTTIVPVHANESIGKGLLHKILHDCELAIEEISEHL